MGGGSPSIDQDSYRFRNDNGSEAAATWRQNINVNDTIPVDTTFRLRFLAQNAGTASLLNIDFEFQYNLAGAGWNNITATSSVVKAVLSGNFAEGDDCTKQLGAGTFHTNNNGMTEDGISGGAVLDLAAGSETETECSLQIVGTDVTNGQTIQIRLVRDGGTVLDTYTRTPTITVQELNQYTMNAEPGSYSVTGADTTNVRALTVNAAAGSYEINGAAAAIGRSFTMDAEPGDYTISGAASTMLVDRVLNAEPGSYPVSGADMSFTRAISMNAEPGAYAITGAELAALRAFSLHAEAGAYAIAGADAMLEFSGGGPAPSVSDWLIRARRRLRR